MNVNTKNNISFKGLYNNKLLLRGLKCAQENGSLFAAKTTLALSLVARPIAIISTPKTDKENKKIACVKSIASSIAGYFIMFVASTPVANAVKKIDLNPEKYLHQESIKTLKKSANNLQSSKNYKAATQIFKLGTSVIVAIPKSVLTCMMIPPLLAFLFPKSKSKQNISTLNKIPEKQINSKSNIISFKGIGSIATEGLAKTLGKTMNKDLYQKFAQKIADTNFAQYIMYFTDILLTASFVYQAKKDKNIDEKRKKPLIHNSLISTGLCITGGYGLNKLLDKPTEKFIEKFRFVNKSLPDLDKYVEGIKIAKPVLILGGIYYIFIPIISTFIADRTAKENSN